MFYMLIYVACLFYVAYGSHNETPTFASSDVLCEAANTTNTNATATNATNASVEPPEPAAKVTCLSTDWQLGSWLRLNLSMFCPCLSKKVDKTI